LAPALVVSPPPPAPAPVHPPARFDPFGFDVTTPRPVAPGPPPAAEDDWRDVEVAPAAPRPPVAVAPPPRPPAAVPAPLPAAALIPPPPPPAPTPVPAPALAPAAEVEPTLELMAASGFEPIDLPAEEPAEPPLLAPMHEFVPPAATTGHQPEPGVVQGGAGVVVGRVTPADGGEAALRDALSGASREVIERVVWEVVPQLAETIIRENLDRLVKARQG
jgi:hypothetical protein